MNAACLYGFDVQIAALHRVAARLGFRGGHALNVLVLLVIGWRFRTVAAGQPAGSEFRVNSHTTSNQVRPRLASDQMGNFVVVWQSLIQDGSYYGVFGQRYSNAGVPLGDEFLVNTHTTNSQAFPSVAMDAAGNFVVAWGSVNPNGSSSGVFGQRYNSVGTGLGAEFQVNTYTTSDQTTPAVAVDADGDFVVVWQSYAQDGSNLGVFGQRYSSTGVALGAEFRGNSSTWNSQSEPSVSSDATGNFVVVWQSYGQDGSYQGIFGQRYSNAGAPLGAEFLVNSRTTSLQWLPSVASDPIGNFVVVWQSSWTVFGLPGQDGSYSGVFCQRYDSAGARRGAEFQVNAYTTGEQKGPSVAVDSGGNVVIVWQSAMQDGSESGIVAQLYGSSGTPLGTEFRVNSFTPNNQSTASVANDSSGNFVVVWQSQFNDGSAYGVFGQRFLVDHAPLVTQQPASQNVCAGALASFSAAANGFPEPTVQWQVLTDAGVNWNDVAGATATPLTFTANVTENNNQYRAVFSNALGSGTSDAASLIVSIDGMPPVVTTPPALTITQTLCE